ncbi:AAA domain-containing protein [Marinobacterium arenosum]|uniref:AAA domain-containing protein n=1 Tax=Marinobacterium arenosum TaxID=2862496 RepID=UPI001C96954B|nr:AAA domain-containing protein [Marinobacterium arenosum]MBY4678887.1 hypothetical protein [Marinobacterium arenosum]
MSHITQLTRYFKQSLLDAEALCPEDKVLKPALGLANADKSAESNDYLSLTHDAWLEGVVDPGVAKQIFAKKQPKNRPPLDEVELVLFPRVDMRQVRFRTPNEDTREILLPLAVFVSLQKDGRLLPSEKAPWIPRPWLAPNEGREEPFSDFALVDEFLTLNPYSGITSWPQLVTYCTAMLYAAKTESYSKPEPAKNRPGSCLYDLLIHPQYVLSGQCLLQLDPPIYGAKFRILKVLDTLLKKDRYPLLYQRFCHMESPPLDHHRDQQHNLELARQHVGQMSGEFPLSPKQRSALHYQFMQGDGEILAVNGPPGTGKTTLLRSVVANLWTQAALEEAEPPLIAATSNNNQAVTNILESFARIDEEGLEECLQGRWLPELFSYGLYCCASSKANKRKNRHQFLGPSGQGHMDDWQCSDYVTEATAHFLACASHWQGEPVATAREARQRLLRTMRQTKRQIDDGVDRLEAFQVVDAELREKVGSFEGLKAALDKLDTQLREVGELVQSRRTQRDDLYRLWEKRSLLLCLLLWLPPLRKQEQRKTRRLLQNWQIPLTDFSDEAVERWFEDEIARQEREQASLASQQKRLQSLLERYQAVKEKLTQWCRSHHPGKLFGQSPAEQVSEVSDRALRFKLFKLATHYWEARWLEDMEDFLARDDQREFFPDKVQGKLRRFAKLTPCFVSTFYMLPAMVNAWKDGESFPLLGEIDLLIVDEAGQAVPDVSAAGFALAKKALIVGDTDQVEPVWNLPEGVDRSNLKLFGLLEDDDSYENFWRTSGLLSSSGSVMHVAQRHCRYHQLPHLGRGLYLTEHRRCYDSIISYCNELVYEGGLEPLRGEPETAVPWGTMAMVPVETLSETSGSSRGNPGEAKRIAEWLCTERSRILDYARSENPDFISQDDAEVLRRVVGIVTPFSQQARWIRRELEAVGITGLTVGTVHSLQGDERLIVLFSSVYGRNDSSLNKFYDRGTNMLNVAVSRAKDAFIVFGDPQVFGQVNSAKPSKVLRQRLSLIDVDCSTEEADPAETVVAHVGEGVA